MTPLSKGALLLSVYSIDEHSQLFSHQGRIARDLAKQFSYTYVLMNDEFPVDLNARDIFTDVFSLKSSSKVAFVVKSWLLVLRSYKKHRRNLVVFSFMTDYFSAVTGPLTKVLRVKHILWYAHAYRSIFLIISELFVSKIISSTRESLPSKSKKAKLLGQMVDSGLFNFKRDRDYGLKASALFVGRVDKTKGLDEIISALATSHKFKKGFKLLVIGEPTLGNEAFYNNLRSEIYSKNLEESVLFLGARSANEVNDLMSTSDFLIHNFKGSLDKVLVEAALTGLPIVTTNRGFHRAFSTSLNASLPIREMRIDDELELFFRLTPKEIAEQAEHRYKTALSDHTYESWFNKLLVEFDIYD